MITTQNLVVQIHHMFLRTLELSLLGNICSGATKDNGQDSWKKSQAIVSKVVEASISFFMKTTYIRCVKNHFAVAVIACIRVLM